MSLPFGNDAVSWRSWDGDPDLPRVLLVHGGSGSWLHWLPVLPFLRRSLRIAAIDLPGFGASRRIRVAGIEDVVGGLQRVIAHHEDLAAVISFSFGSTVAAMALDGMADAPDLHVLAPGGWGPTAIPEGAFLRRPARLSEAGKKWIDRHNLSVAMMPPGTTADERATRLYRCALRQTSFDSRPFSFSTEFQQRIARLPLRSALWAGADAFMLPDLDRRMAITRKTHPEARQNVVPGAGHWLQYEAPRTVADWLIDQIR